MVYEKWTMGFKLHNARRSYELRDLFWRLQNKWNILACEVHFLSSGVYDGDIGFVEPSEEDIEFCGEAISILNEVGSELQDAEKYRDIVQVITITFVL